MWVLLGVDGGHLPSKYSGPKNRGHLSDIPYAVAWTPGWNQAVHAVTDIVCQQGTLHAACIHLTPDACGPLETEEEFHLLVLGADQWQAQWSGQSLTGSFTRHENLIGSTAMEWTLEQCMASGRKDFRDIRLSYDGAGNWQAITFHQDLQAVRPARVLEQRTSAAGADEMCLEIGYPGWEGVIES
jgi:hypothetical protein